MFLFQLGIRRVKPIETPKTEPVLPPANPSPAQKEGKPAPTIQTSPAPNTIQPVPRTFTAPPTIDMDMTPSLSESAKSLEKWAQQNEPLEQASRLMFNMGRMILDEDKSLMGTGGDLDMRVARARELADQFAHIDHAQDMNGRGPANKAEADLSRLAADLLHPRNDSVNEIRAQLSENQVLFILRVTKDFHELYTPGWPRQPLKAVDDIVTMAYAQAGVAEGEMYNRTYRDVENLLIQGQPTAVHAPAQVMPQLARILRYFVSEGVLQVGPAPAAEVEEMVSRIQVDLTPFGTMKPADAAATRKTLRDAQADALRKSEWMVTDVLTPLAPCSTATATAGASGRKKKTGASPAQTPAARPVPAPRPATPAVVSPPVEQVRHDIDTLPPAQTHAPDLSGVRRMPKEAVGKPADSATVKPAISVAVDSGARARPLEQKKPAKDSTRHTILRLP